MKDQTEFTGVESSVYERVILLLITYINLVLKQRQFMDTSNEGTLSKGFKV